MGNLCIKRYQKVADDNIINVYIKGYGINPLQFSETEITFLGHYLDFSNKFNKFVVFHEDIIIISNTNNQNIYKLNFVNGNIQIFCNFNFIEWYNNNMQKLNQTIERRF